MTKYSKFNIIYRLQKWLDSVPGQTFMNYAYSWGASIVILGALFKLTHLPGANFWLFLGMGTEVLVFFISGFDRPFDKTEDGKELPTHVNLDELTEEGVPVAGEGLPGSVPVAGEGVPVTGVPVAGGGVPVTGEGVPVSGEGGSIVFGGGGGAVIIGGGAQGGVEGSHTEGVPVEGMPVSGGIGGGPVVIGGGAASPELPKIDGEEMEEATKGFVEQLRELTETLQQLAEYSQHLTRNSEEIENLNRTLTGITKIYELQLKGASAQMGTQDQIVAQTQRMAEQIQQLNDIYTRMIKAMTVTVPSVNEE